MPVALGVLPPATLAHPYASRAQATHTTPGMDDSMDGGGRTVPATHTDVGR